MRQRSCIGRTDPENRSAPHGKSLHASLSRALLRGAQASKGSCARCHWHSRRPASSRSSPHRPMGPTHARHGLTEGWSDLAQVQFHAFADADRAYDSDPHRQKLRERGIDPKIARRRTAHDSRLGIYRWVVERTVSWLHSFRRLRLRTDRNGTVHDAFTALASALICMWFFAAQRCVWA